MKPRRRRTRRRPAAWCASLRGRRTAGRGRTAGSAAPATTISSTSTEASAIGWNTMRASSGAIGTTSSTATARSCTRHRQAVPRRDPDRRGRQQRQDAARTASARGMPRSRAAPHEAADLDRRRQHREHRHQADRRRPAAGLERGQRERREGGDVAERHEDHPRDGEDQHQAEAGKQVDGPVGEAVDAEDEPRSRRSSPVVSVALTGAASALRARSFHWPLSSRRSPARARRRRSGRRA